MASESELRQIVTVVESTPSATGKAGWRRAAAIAVVTNPLAAKYEEDLTELSVLGGVIAEKLLASLQGCVEPAQAVAIGRAAAVGQDGEIEHASALIGPGFDAASKAALFVTEAEPPSTRARVKVGGAVDVAFQPRKGADGAPTPATWRLTVDGHPKDDEAVIVLALAAPE